MHSKRDVTMTRRFSVRLLICFAILGFSTAAARAQEWAEKMFATTKIDFGVVARGSDAVYRLKLKNIYQEDVHISNVRTTCGCSAASPSKTTLKSLEEAYVQVTMDTRKFTRRKDSNVIVTFDAPYPAEIRIPITAYIRTDVVLEPGGAVFGAVQQGEPNTRKISLSYAGRPDWKIESVEVGNPHLAVKAVETARGGGRVSYDILFAISEKAPVGGIREQINLVTDDARSPRVPILVEATVEADITVTPPIVSLGQLRPGETKRVSVVLRGRKAFAIEKIEADSDTGAFRVQLPKDARIVHVLPLSVTTPNKPGDFSETFTVTVTGRAEPLQFQAAGKIMEPEAGGTN